MSSHLGDDKCGYFFAKFWTKFAQLFIPTSGNTELDTLKCEGQNDGGILSTDQCDQKKIAKCL